MMRRKGHSSANTLDASSLTLRRTGLEPIWTPTKARSFTTVRHVTNPLQKKAYSGPMRKTAEDSPCAEKSDVAKSSATPGISKNIKNKSIADKPAMIELGYFSPKINRDLSTTL